MFGQKLLYLRKLFVFRECGCIPARWLYLVKKWLSSGKTASIRAKVVVFGQSFFYSGESGCNRANAVVFGKKWLYSDKSGSIGAKVVQFGQKMLFLGKVVLFGQIWL